MTKQSNPDNLEYWTANIPWAMKAIRQEQERLAHYVHEARRLGASWAELGAILGISRQAAQQRFGRS